MDRLSGWVEWMGCADGLGGLVERMGLVDGLGGWVGWIGRGFALTWDERFNVKPHLLCQQYQ